jgi:hypothetical protein
MGQLDLPSLLIMFLNQLKAASYHIYSLPSSTSDTYIR